MSQKRFVAVKSFVDRINGKKWRVGEGEEFDALPKGANWVTVGFVLDRQAETAVAEEPEKPSRSKKK